ncbi:hypothetical protein [Paenibacillus aestuarii]|uniref:Uncharacterized protein n=1 Tax=Paenibacillus aestuarii TaxID=516965 RepID=A0ABW0KGU2_9BACL|nr:hypothetical protein [Paenibacillus aestuarii]
MEPGIDKKKDHHREITYQVGWKKGKIEWQEGAGAEGGGKAHTPEELHAASCERRLQLLWRAVPALPGALLLPLLYALPVICFMLTILLVYHLRLHS